MTNDSTRKPKRTPAIDPAQAPSFDGDSLVSPGRSAVIPAIDPALAPVSRRVEEMSFVRKDGIEMTFSGGKWFMRDIDLGRTIGLSRPRYIRERIRSMIERGDINEMQVIAVSDDGNTVFFIDQETATSLAFRSNVAGAEAIAKRMMRVNVMYQGKDDSEGSIPIEKALNGYHRMISFISKKETLRAAKLASLPVLEKYARAAGLPTPDVSELIGPDQPRLMGV